MYVNSLKVIAALVLILFAGLVSGGCVQNSLNSLKTIGTTDQQEVGVVGEQSLGQQAPSKTDEVSIVDEDSRVHLNTKLTTTDFQQFAEKITNKMLKSRIVQGWKAPPLLVVAVPENTTHDANIIAEDIQDAIFETILGSGVARIIDESSVSSEYDYIVKSKITSTEPQRASNGRKLVYY